MKCNRLIGLSLCVNRRKLQVNASVDVRQQTRKVGQCVFVVRQKTRKIGQCVYRCHVIGEKYRSMSLSFFISRPNKSVNGSVSVYLWTQSLQYNTFVSTRNPMQDTLIKPNVSMHQLYSIRNYLLAGTQELHACINLTRRGMWARVDLQILRDS